MGLFFPSFVAHETNICLLYSIAEVDTYRQGQPSHSLEL